MEGLEPNVSLSFGAPEEGVGVPGLAEGERPYAPPEPPPIFKVMVGLPDMMAVDGLELAL